MNSAETPLLHRSLLDLSPAAIVVIGELGHVSFATPAASRLFGHDLKGLAWMNLAAPQGREATLAYLGALSSSESPATMFTSGEYRHIDGRALWLEIRGVNLSLRPEVDGLALVLTDVTRHRLQLEEIERVAVRDGLTGLGNRSHFVRQLEAALRTGPDCVVGFADIDQFKGINDRYGHMVGDEVLRDLAQHMVDALPAEAIVCRVGGDEFGFVIPGELTMALRSAIDRLRSVEIAVDSETPAVTSVTTSIGLTSGGRRGVYAVVQELDVAVYVAKLRGRQRVVLFDTDAANEIRSYRHRAEEFAQLVERNEQLHAEARTDALTGLANRRALAEVEPMVVGNPGSRWASCALLFIDVDHFGRYNKLYGDQAGDVALQAIAKCLQESARATDLVYRKGGEEFVVILPHTDFAVAWTVAERMRTNVSLLCIDHAEGGAEGRLSILVSVATVRPGSTVASAVGACGDEAMRAKETGLRGRVIGSP